MKLKNDKIVKSSEQENTGAEKSKLFPTDLGSVVNDFLIQHFDNVMDFGFTAKIESEFDDIAEGRVDWSKMLKNFYEPFKKLPPQPATFYYPVEETQTAPNKKKFFCNFFVWGSFSNQFF